MGRNGTGQDGTRGDIAAPNTLDQDYTVDMATFFSETLYTMGGGSGTEKEVCPVG